MNLENYDWSRLAALGYPQDFAERMKDDPCWKGYAMVGQKKKGGSTVPNCVPIKKSDHAEPDIQDGRVHGGSKRRPFIPGPSAGPSTFGEGVADEFAQCVKPNGSTYGTKGECQPPNKPLHHTLKKTEKKREEKMCNQYQPWAPLGMQNVVVPCKNLGLK